MKINVSAAAKETRRDRNGSMFGAGPPVTLNTRQTACFLCHTASNFVVLHCRCGSARRCILKPNLQPRIGSLLQLVEVY